MAECLLALLASAPRCPYFLCTFVIAFKCESSTEVQRRTLFELSQRVLVLERDEIPILRIGRELDVHQRADLWIEHLVGPLRRRWSNYFEQAEDVPRILYILASGYE